MLLPRAYLFAVTGRCSGPTTFADKPKSLALAVSDRSVILRRKVMQKVEPEQQIEREKQQITLIYWRSSIAFDKSSQAK